MKTFLKLVFLGVIIGLAVKFLNEKQVNVKETALHILERVEQELSSLDVNPRTGTDVPSGSQNNYSESFQGDNSNQNQSGTDMTDSDIVPEEITIRKKPRQGYDRFQELDQYAASVPEAYEKDLDMLVRYLVQPAQNKLERTRLVFRWIAHHVSYDDHGYNTGHYGNLSAEGVFRSRMAVCQGFSELFKIMGEKAGLDIVLVTGYSKGISYRSGQSFDDTNHAWNLVYLDRQWRLFDVTWAQGYGTAVNGKLVSIKKFDDYWFNTPPDEFIFTHLPENPKWQLTSIPLSISQYERLPYASASYFKLGFDGTHCLLNACKGALKSFPESYLNDGSIQALSLPYQEEIRSHQPFTVRLTSRCPVDIAIINNGEWVHLKKEGFEYMAVINPRPGKLKLSARYDKHKLSYNTLLEYQVN